MSFPWGDVLSGGLSALGGFFGKKDEAKQSKELTEMEIRARAELQDDQQAFEQFLIDRRNVAGGAAYGGSASVEDFWGGQNSPEVAEGLKGLFANMPGQNASYTPPASIAPSPEQYSQAGQRDPQSATQYQAREEYQSPLKGLMGFLRGGGNQGSPLLRQAYKQEPPNG